MEADHVIARYHFVHLVTAVYIVSSTLTRTRYAVPHSPHRQTAITMSNSQSTSGPIHSFDTTRALSEARLQDPNVRQERKKRVVVTGGSGGLGRWVVREMVDHGWEVYNCE